jgi:CCR4-NOT transcription complex subunit 7/8
MYAQESIDMLSNAAGIDFSRSIDLGIDQSEFGELLISSGLVLLEDITWITFTGYNSPRKFLTTAAMTLDIY